METTIQGLGFRKYGVYGDLIILYLKPYSIYLRGTINSHRYDLEIYLTYLIQCLYSRP